MVDALYEALFCAGVSARDDRLLVDLWVGNDVRYRCGHPHVYYDPVIFASPGLRHWGCASSLWEWPLWLGGPSFRRLWLVRPYDITLLVCSIKMPPWRWPLMRCLRWVWCRKGGSRYFPALAGLFILVQLVSKEELAAAFSGCASMLPLGDCALSLGCLRC